ncbi:MAG: hypothetical protein IJJ33_16630 [Victivallales bacterium]|nr:hypothetical protein [Victivallales bacterium]
MKNICEFLFFFAGGMLAALFYINLLFLKSSLPGHAHQAKKEAMADFNNSRINYMIPLNNKINVQEENTIIINDIKFHVKYHYYRMSFLERMYILSPKDLASKYAKAYNDKMLSLLSKKITEEKDL